MPEDFVCTLCEQEFIAEQRQKRAEQEALRQEQAQQKGLTESTQPADADASLAQEEGQEGGQQMPQQQEQLQGDQQPQQQVGEHKQAQQGDKDQQPQQQGEDVSMHQTEPSAISPGGQGKRRRSVSPSPDLQE